jgi:predicted flap endonuclease-1-like 5' DNA nuclease
MIKRTYTSTENVELMALERLNENFLKPRIEFNRGALENLKVVEGVFIDATKDVFCKLDGQLDLVKLEKEGVARGKNLLAKTAEMEVDDENIGISGRIEEKNTKRGLANIAVELSLVKDGKKEIVRTETDKYGGFQLEVNPDALEKVNNTRKLPVRVVGDSSGATGRRSKLAEKTFNISAKPGDTQDISVSVRTTDAIRERARFAEALDGQIENDAKLLREKEEVITRARKLGDELSSIGLAEVRSVARDLESEPPYRDVPSEKSEGVSRKDLFADDLRRFRDAMAPVKEDDVPLEKVTGIGDVTATKLRALGIRTANALAKMRISDVRRIGLLSDASKSVKSAREEVKAAKERAEAREKAGTKKGTKKKATAKRKAKTTTRRKAKTKAKHRAKTRTKAKAKTKRKAKPKAKTRKKTRARRKTEPKRKTRGR